MQIERTHAANKPYPFHTSWDRIITMDSFYRAMYMSVRSEFTGALTLKDGEILPDALARICDTQQRNAVMVTSGIGMLREIEIGYWNGAEYETETVKGACELISMSGSVALLEGRLSAHLHVAFSDRSHVCRGGHLVKATVHNINEISLVYYRQGSFERHYSPKTHLNMLEIAED